jgi:pSer/pThr/pTyr-binding forkhead associated (FHA) protein
MLKEFMIEQYAAGKTLLLVIDEAQNLSRRVLEELRMLSGIEAQKEKLLRVILAGQPELAKQLDQPRLEQLKQRVRLQFHLGALSKRETREYIEHRLEVAGAAGRKIIEEEAFDPIFAYSGGVPRLVNTLCDTAMLCGFAEEVAVISAELVMTAVDELQWKPFIDRYQQPVQATEEHSVDIEDTGRRKGVVELPARFDVLFNDKQIAEFSLSVGRTIIGRTEDNDLQLSSQFISRHHAQVSTNTDSCTLEDLNSTNGVFVGTRRVKHHRLVDGDVIHLGEHKLVYHDLRASTGNVVAIGLRSVDAD